MMQLIIIMLLAGAGQCWTLCPKLLRMIVWRTLPLVLLHLFSGQMNQHQPLQASVMGRCHLRGMGLCVSRHCMCCCWFLICWGGWMLFFYFCYWYVFDVLCFAAVLHVLDVWYVLFIDSKLLEIESSECIAL